MEIDSDPENTDLRLEIMHLNRKLTIEKLKLYVMIIDAVSMQYNGIFNAPEPISRITELATEIADCEDDDLTELYNKYNKPL